MRFVIFPLLSVLTLFILPIVVYWRKSMQIKLFYKSTYRKHATHILVEGSSGNLEIIELKLEKLNVIDREAVTFTYRFIKYQYDSVDQRFKAVVFNALQKQEDLLQIYGGGLDDDQVNILKEKYGPCQLIVPRKSIPKLLVDEVLNPFYIFQVFSVALWMWDGCEKYAYCIMVISFISIFENLYETVKNINNIRKMAIFECPIEIKRKSGFMQMSSSELVPGDVVVVPDNCLMPCDMVLLTGSCIVNESMLTGESVPVMKNCIAPIKDLYDPTNYD
jgi:magnesium-transporting ATPase (P-type)